MSGWPVALFRCPGPTRMITRRRGELQGQAKARRSRRGIREQNTDIMTAGARYGRRSGVSISRTSRRVDRRSSIPYRVLIPVSTCLGARAEHGAGGPSVLQSSTSPMLSLSRSKSNASSSGLPRPTRIDSKPAVPPGPPLPGPGGPEAQHFGLRLRAYRGQSAARVFWSG